MKSQRPILLVEDDIIDVMSMKRALKELKVLNELYVAENGEEALKMLKIDKCKLPCIILLDINMPKMNGIEFLKIIKADIKLKLIPVVVLTTSKEEQDKINSFNLGVSGYILKPPDYYKFVETVRTINIYWSLSEMPVE